TSSPSSGTGKRSASIIPTSSAPRPISVSAECGVVENRVAAATKTAAPATQTGATTNGLRAGRRLLLILALPVEIARGDDAERCSAHRHEQEQERRSERDQARFPLEQFDPPLP